MFHQAPKGSTTVSETHASLTTSTQSYGDFEVTWRMKTVKQLRTGSAPNSWEGAWMFWHFTDNWHNYVLVLKTSGFQIEKKDNNTKSDTEIYLQTPKIPKVKLGQWQALKLRVTNSTSNTPRIQVWVDGIGEPTL